MSTHSSLTGRNAAHPSRWLTRGALAAACIAAFGCGGTSVPVDPPSEPTDPPAGTDTNPYHLEVEVTSPYIGDGQITSQAPGHHLTYGGDVSFDTALASGASEGEPVYFEISDYWLAETAASQVKGVVALGGSDALEYACASKLYSDGGYKVRVEIWAQYGGTWYDLGWATYAHLDSIYVFNGEELGDGSLLGVVTAQHGGTCSTGPHTHIELYNKKHYPCYVSTTPFGEWDTIARVGGSRTSVMECP